MTPLPFRRRLAWAVRIVAMIIAGGWGATWLRDRYPGLYVLVVVVGVCATVWLWVKAIETRADDMLAEHHRAELERTTADSALLMELRDMFAARACDWLTLSSMTYPTDSCPACRHLAFRHDPLTKVCDVCHAPRG